MNTHTHKAPTLQEKDPGPEPEVPTPPAGTSTPPSPSPSPSPEIEADAPSPPPPAGPDQGDADQGEPMTEPVEVSVAIMPAVRAMKSVPRSGKGNQGFTDTMVRPVEDEV